MKVRTLYSCVSRTNRLFYRQPYYLVFFIAVPLLLITLVNTVLSPAYRVLATADQNALSPAQLTVPGFAMLFTMIGAGTLAMRLNYDRETGWELFLASPIWRPALPVAWAVTVYSLVILQGITLFVAGWLFFGMELGNTLGVILVLFVFSLVPIGIGLGIASLTDNDVMMQQVTLLVGILCSFLGGGIIPLALMEPWAHPLAELTPNYWAMGALHSLMANGESIRDIWLSLVVLVLYGMIPLVGGLMLFAYRRYQWGN